MRPFIWAMRQAPYILVVAAIALYVSEVFTAMFTQQELQELNQDLMPWTMRFRALFYLFVKPLGPPLIIFFGAAALWRWDTYRLVVTEVSE